MNVEGWDVLSAWLADWVAADPAERARLRARLAAEHPELVAEADALALTTGQLEGFLETPAVVLAARQLAQDDPLLPAGSMVGPYRVVALLARGGMGDVYRATDARLHRDVALKVLAPNRTGDPQRVDRFMQEARVTASLDHPNVVRVYDVGRVDERAYLVAELLDGETLRSRISRGAIPAAEAVRIAADVAKGLAAAHAAGLVHRDLKPDNIFITRSGAAKILDFGIAKLAHDDIVPDRFATLTGVVLGTAGYLAPEQIRGEAVDARADLFALGCVMFEMLTGTRAFARDHLVETLHAILHEPPTAALADRHDIPPQLASLVMTLLEKSPPNRVSTAAELIAVLETMDLSARRRPFSFSLARWAAVLLVALVALLLSTTMLKPVPVRIAVMPLRTVPAASADAQLELGMAEVLIQRLGELAEVYVVPLSATARAGIRDQDPREVARQLDVDRVLQVTLHRESSAVRAVPTLVSRAGGATWSASVHADASGLEWVQNILKEVVAELTPRLSVRSRKRVDRPGTRSPQAFDAYVRGRAEVLNPNVASLNRAKGFFDQALNLDLNYADALAGLGSVYKRMAIVAAVPSSQAFPEAENQARRALQIDPDHGEAHSVQGTVDFWYHWNYPKAERELRRALELQPSSPDSHLFLGHLFANTGRDAAALAHIRLARAFDPNWPLPRAHEGHFLFMARKYEDALAHLNASTQAHPDFWPGQTFRIFPLLALGQYGPAIEQADLASRVRQGRPGESSGFKGYALARAGRELEAEHLLSQIRTRNDGQRRVGEALVLLGLRRFDEALSQLEAAVDEKAMAVTFLGVYPWWDELRDTPRFQAILRRVNLLDVSERVRAAR